MTWISLICLLVLSSSAFGGYGGGYGGASINQVPKLISMMRDRPVQRPIISQGYGQQVQQPLPVDWSSALPQQQQDFSIQQKLQSGGYGSSMQKSLPIQGYGQISQGYGAMPIAPQFDQQVQQVQQVPVLTAADQLCRGQQPETVIPIEDNRKFVVCLDDGKGVEQQCPKGLFYHPTSLRCERKLGPLENVCASQPCLNGGQCIPTDSTYQCQCAPGFDGKTCELDARVCHTQFPCGQSQDVKCQSFRLGAALQYVCIFQDGLAYGLSTSQIVPSPCRDVDGPQALAVSNNGFIMCDGERLFVESCPGGTIWDDLNKACVWPDMQAVPQQDQSIYGQSSYGQQQPKLIQSSYGSQWTVPQPEQTKLIQPSYGSQWTVPQPEQPKLIQPSYGAQWPAPQPEQPKLIQSSYGSQWPAPQPEQTKLIQPSYGSQWTVPQPEQPKLIQPSYGAQWPVPQPEQTKLIQSSYGAQWPAPQLEQQTQFTAPRHHHHHAKHLNAYGSKMVVPQQLEQPKLVESSYGSQQQQQQQTQQQDELVSIKQSSGY